MGYLAQRKNSARKAAFLFVTTTAFCLFILSSFVYEYLRTYYFQVFMMLCISVVYSLSNRLGKYVIINTALAVAMFIIISSSTTLFVSDSNPQAKTPLRVFYQSKPHFLVDTFEEAIANKADIFVVDKPAKLPPLLIEILPHDTFIANGKEMKDGFIVSKFPLTTFAEIEFDKNTFAVVNIKGQKTGITYVNWENRSAEEVAKSLLMLKKFIAQRDEPLLVFGNFNTVSWTEEFADFLTQTGLEVKNPIVFEWKNIVTPNTFFVLGYKNMNFKGFEELPQKDNLSAPYILELEMFTQN